MGQEQSLANPASSLDRQGLENFRVVQVGDGQTPAVPAQLADELLVRSVNALPLPHPILPSPPVKDDVKSALSGAQVIYELRTALESLRPDPGKRVNPHRSQQPSNNADSLVVPPDQNTSEQTGAEGAEQREVDIRSTGRSENESKRSQEVWAHVALDQDVVRDAIDGMGGGRALRAAVREQERLTALVLEVRAAADRVQRSMEVTEKEARRTRKALEAVERLRMVASDVQDGLEYAVATANILGAAHFAHDEEMRSFKDYLRHHPPNYLRQIID